MVSGYPDSLKGRSSKPDFTQSREVQGCGPANMQPGNRWSYLLGGGSPEKDVNKTEIGAES